MKQHAQAGFSLLEMVVSLAVVAIVSTVLSQVFISTIRTNTKTELLKEVKQNGDLALETITRMIQNATSISSACVDTGEVSQALTIIQQDGGQTTLECALIDGVTRLASTSAAKTEYLTSPSVTMGGSSCDLSSLQFVCKGGIGVPTSVTVAFRLAQSGLGIDLFERASEVFQTSVSMRNISL